MRMWSHWLGRWGPWGLNTEPLRQRRVWGGIRPAPRVVWGGSWGWGGGGSVLPLPPPNPALSRCAAGDTGRGMAPTCPQMPSAPSPGSDWVGRGPGGPERTPLLPARDFAYVARDPLTQVLKCHVFRCEGPASAIAAGLHRVCAQVRPPRPPQDPPQATPWPAPCLCPSETPPLWPALDLHPGKTLPTPAGFLPKPSLWPAPRLCLDETPQKPLRTPLLACTLSAPR